MFLIVLANGVQNRQRRAMHLSCDAPRDLTRAAMALLGEPSRPAKDEFALFIADLRKVRRLLNLIPMRREKPIDAAQQKPHALLAVCEDKPPRRQPAPPPALNRLAGDVEFLGDIIDRKHRLAESRRMDVQRLAEPLDEQTQIMLQCDAGDEIAVDVFGVI